MFRDAVSDRGASIRVPMVAAQEGKGYLEDRRPSANMDPYVVTRLLIEVTVLGITDDNDPDAPDKIVTTEKLVAA